MRYEGDIYRPPSEANSYILQCTVGCSHNKCTFCGMYKGKKYRVRDIKEIIADIRMAKLYFQQVEKVFLADGDALAMDTADLITILDELHRHFPELRHVGIYTSPDSILKKTPQDLKTLSEHGLNMAYLGVETGDKELLKSICKGVTYEEMVEAGRKVREAGIPLSVTLVLGLAGRTPQAVDHAIKSAQICNEINPDYIAALTIMPVQGTVLYKQIQQGKFEVPQPFEILEELRLIIENLEVTDCEFRSNHASNYLAIKGRLPEDKQKILRLIDEVIKRHNSEYLRPEYMRRL